MASFPSNPYLQLSSREARQVDEICLRFEESWRKNENPPLETYLPEGKSDSITEALLWELLRIEVQHRRQLKDVPKPEDYLGRLPDHEETIKAVFAQVFPHNALTMVSEENQAQSYQETVSFHANRKVSLSGKIHPEDFPLTLGEYELFELIGQGGMGVVYKARPALGGEDYVVALKRIKTGMLEYEDEVQRFKFEALALARLSHPNILPIYHVGEQEGQYYFTMKLMEGGSLSKKLPELQKDPRVTAQLIAKIARAIHYAHERGILHRDLKPSNILFDEQGEPVVIDFGLAKRLQGDAEMSQSGLVCGTINSMPPEQARGSLSLTISVDVYSLGAVLYECLTGQPPYKAENYYQFVMQMDQKDPLLPRKLNPLIPNDLQTICLHSLKKVPEQRYKSAEKMAEDLENWLEDKPIQARPVSSGERVWLWCRRHPAIASLTAVLILALLAGGGLVTYFAIQSHHRALEAEWRQYVIQVDLIHRELLNGNYRSAKQRLDTCPEQFRHWEYDYLSRLYEKSKPCVLPHEDPVWSFALSPDGSRMTSVTAKGAIIIWDWQRRKKLSEKDKAHKGTIWEVKYSPDGRWLATPAEDGTVKLWDADSLTLLATIRREGNPGTEAWAVVFGPDGNFLVTGWEDKKVIFWRLNQKKAGNITINKSHVLEHKYGIWNMGFSPNGKWLATASGAFQPEKILPGGELRIWEIQEKEAEPTLVFSDPRANACTELAFSPNGQWLACSGYDKSTVVYRQSPEEKLYERHGLFRGHTDRRVISVAFHPQHSYLATGGWDKTVNLWDLTTLQLKRPFPDHHGPLGDIRFSHDGRYLIAASSNLSSTGEIRIWDWDLGRHKAIPLPGHSKEARAVAFSEDEDHPLLASGGEKGSIQLWDLQTRKKQSSFPQEGEKSSPVNCLDFHGHKTSWLASGHQDGTVILWNTETGQVIRSFTQQNVSVLSVCFSPDGKRLAAGFGNREDFRKQGEAKVWDVESGKLLFPSVKTQTSAFHVAFTTQGDKLVTSSAVVYKDRWFLKGEVKLWSVESGEFLEELPLDHRNRVQAAVYNPTGTILATASSDQTIKLWDVRKKKVLHTLEGHTGGVQSLAFTPDGKRLASAGLDHTIRVWEVRKGREVLTLRGSEEFLSVDFGPNGRYLAAAKSDGIVNLYDAGSKND